ncbi:hypothetical protein Tsubulata_029061 [Turnera subulata]|uniref:Uncharacterized protein n=1 Tax=Turnera subulata TaxID=218843 RepID=A0A9Q0F873_9ROSI|nr:hypothetical protein Tsubulata_029061 [Turnera subulata]
MISTQLGRSYKTKSRFVEVRNSHSITSSSLPNFFPDTLLLSLRLHFPSPSPFSSSSSSSSSSPHHRRGTFSEWPGSSWRLRQSLVQLRPQNA